MSDDRHSAAAQEQPEGVFGNLPGSRPGSRSPRRDPAKSRSAKATGEPAEPQAARQRARAGGAPAGGGEPDPEPASDTSGLGIEDLAWAGVAVAAEAATLGVRLAGRAVEALRETVDRR